MKTYEKYKDSETDYLSELPSHWAVIKLKFIGSIFSGISGKKGEDFSNEPIKNFKPYIPFTNICNNRIIDPEQMGYVNIDEDENQNIVQKNDFLFLMSSETEEDVGKSSLYLSEKKVYLNSFCKGFRLKGINDPFFINYYLSSKEIESYFSINSRGFTRINLRQEYVKDVPVLLPPLPEQRQIAAYLDYKTKQIDRFIANRKKQIELLEEQKEAIIKKAVTKGIDSAVPLKESNVEYVGRIPEHWAVAKLKHVATVKGRIGYRGYTTADLVDEGNGALTLGATQFDKYGRVDLDKKVFISWDKYYESPEIMIDKGDLIVVQRGSTSGKVGIIDQDISPATINPSIVLIKKLRINRYFLFYYLRAISDEFSYLNVSQTAIPMLSQNQIENIPLLVVPKDEQEQILLYIETELKERDEIITKFQQQIDLMQEYKTSLISKAVTGKIDVREWQPKQTLKETV